jgi:hypothetical protein
MGPKGAPAYFQQQMQHTVFPDLIQSILEVYLDDIITWADTEENLIKNLEKIFLRLREKNISLNPEKCKLGLTEIEYVGHVINQDGLSFSKEKLDKVDNFRLPQNHKNLKAFLGLASYFRDHVKNFASLTRELQQIITPYKPRQRLDWTNELQTAFYAVQQAVVNCPKIYFLQPGFPIFLQTDASNYGIGAYLFQKMQNTNTLKLEERPIAFLSKTLNKTQLKWSTYEKEAYAIYHSLMKWEHHLRDVHFTLQTDHKNLTYLNTEVKQKVQRWKLIIQEYDFDVEHIAGKDNVVADGLSRFCEFPEELKDSLLTLFTMDILEEFSTEIKEQNQIANNFVLSTEELHDLQTEKRIPPDLYNVIASVHNSGVGHFGIEITLRRLNEEILKKPSLSQIDLSQKRRHVTSFIRACPCCQKMALSKSPVHTKSFTIASYGTWDQIAIDSIGPLH